MFSALSSCQFTGTSPWVSPFSEHRLVVVLAPEPASFTFPRPPSPHQPWVLPGPAGPLHFSLALKRAAGQPSGAGGLPGAEGLLAFPQRPKQLPAGSVLATVGAGPSDRASRPLRPPSQPLPSEHRPSVPPASPSQPRPQGTSLWAGPCAAQFLEPVRLPKGPAQRCRPRVAGRTCPGCLRTLPCLPGGAVTLSHLVLLNCSGWCIEARAIFILTCEARARHSHRALSKTSRGGCLLVLRRVSCRHIRFHLGTSAVLARQPPAPAQPCTPGAPGGICLPWASGAHVSLLPEPHLCSRQERVESRSPRPSGASS